MRMTGNRLDLLVPGPPDQRTGGYLYDARMMAELRASGWNARVHSLDGRFPDPDDTARSSLEAVLSALPLGARVLIDGLAIAALPEIAATVASRVRPLTLVHHPLSDETGLSGDDRLRLEGLERAALRLCQGVVVTSLFTASRVEALGVPPDRIRVAVPGTDPAPAAHGPAPGEPPHLLCVGTLMPRKGQDVLLRALDRIQELPWSCTMAGSADRSPDFAKLVGEEVRRAGLEGRVHIAGELEGPELDDLYASATLLVLPSHYEGYGMVLTEALARGLPIVSTTGGAIPYTVPDGAAYLVPPGDPAALAHVLKRLLGPGGQEEVRSLGEAARRHASLLPDWTEAARGFAQTLIELTPEERFTPSWLNLREAVDHRSRSVELLRPLASAWAERGWSRVVDLGSGTGSNLRYLSPHLPGPQRWTLVDHDAALLARVSPSPARDVTIECVLGDLAAEGLSRAARADLVTASALLDLVAEGWLTQLIETCRRAGCGALLALSYDGTIEWGGPPDPDDTWIRDCMNAHQHGEKGMGRALGPEAGRRAEEGFRRAGFSTRIAASPWRLTASDAELAIELIRGWAEAAYEKAPEEESRARAWLQRREKTLGTGAFELTVGHVDLLALPKGTVRTP